MILGDCRHYSVQIRITNISCTTPMPKSLWDCLRLVIHFVWPAMVRTRPADQSNELAHSPKPYSGFWFQSHVAVHVGSAS
eukprot:13214583-Alexandrium_andersonii.AAC.1